MHYLDNFAGLGRQVYILCLVRVLGAFSFMASFMTPLLFRDVLGMSSLESGVWISVSYAAGILGTIIGGKAADRMSRKRVALAILLIVGITMVWAALICRSRMVVLPVVIGFGAGYGLFPVLSAMVADVCKPERSTESFSLMYLVQNVGFAVGPAVGGLMFYNHLRGMFLLDAAICFVSIGVTALFAEDHYDPVKSALAPSAGGGGTHADSTLRLIYARRPLFIFICSMLIISMCYQMLNFNLSLQMSELFGLEAGSRNSGLIWTVNGIVVIVLTPLIVSLTKKHHQFANMSVALLFYAAGFGMYGFVKSVWLFFAAAAIWTVGEIIINTGAAAFIAANSPATHVARFQSALETCTAAGKTVSPILYGALLKVASYETSWLLNASVCIAVSIFLVCMYRRYAAPQGGSHE
ncbi:MAG: MFS transporter [Firmicutes bacterium]|nr:MFS transporter [Bacillota bacterium]